MTRTLLARLSAVLLVVVATLTFTAQAASLKLVIHEEAGSEGEALPPLSRFNGLKRIEEDVKDLGQVEMYPKTFGRNVIMMFAPRPGASKPRPADGQKKDGGDAKAENEPLGGQAVQQDGARQV